MRNFADVLYQRRSEVKSNIMLTLNTNFGQLPPWLKKGKISEFGKNWAAVSEALAVYEKYLIESVAPYICAVMPRLSSYLQYGAYGIRALECTIVNALKHDLPVIIDARYAEHEVNENIVGKSVIGEIEGWEGNQQSNLHAHAVSIIPYYGIEVVEKYLNLCNETQRGLVVIVKDEKEIADLMNLQSKLTGEITNKTGLVIKINSDKIDLLNKAVKSKLTTFVQFPGFYDAMEMQQSWEGIADNDKQSLFVCLGSEIQADVMNSSNDKIIKDEDIINTHFTTCIEKAEFYQKLFFI